MPRKRSGTPSQRDWRRYIRFHDNHGRPWEGTVEDATLAPVGEVTPAISRKTSRRLWLAPSYWDGRTVREFLPPANFMKYSAVDVGSITIDYDGWWEQANARLNEWLENQMGWYAQQMYPNDWQKQLKKPSADLQRLAGPRPLDPDLIRAAKAGNNWILGIPKPDGTYRAAPSWVEEIWPVKPEVAGRTAGKNYFPDAEDEESDGPVWEEGAAELVPVEEEDGEFMVGR